MTIAEMHTAFKFLIDEKGTGRIKDFQVDLLLNRVIRDFVRERVDPIKKMDNPMIYFEANTRVKNSLSTIVIEENSPTISGQDITAPSDMFTELLLEVDLGNGTITVTPWTHGEASGMMKNNHTKPRKDDPRYIQFGDSGTKKFRIYPSGTISSANIWYVKEPVKVDKGTNTDSDLPPMTHDEIVTNAARIYRGIMEDPQRRKELFELEQES